MVEDDKNNVSQKEGPNTMSSLTTFFPVLFHIFLIIYYNYILQIEIYSKLYGFFPSSLFLNLGLLPFSLITICYIHS